MKKTEEKGEKENEDRRQDNENDTEEERRTEEENDTYDTEENTDVDEELEERRDKPRKSSRTKKKPKPCICCNLVRCMTKVEPISYEDAVNSEQAKDWKNSMEEEMGNMKRNNAWEIVRRPTKQTVIGSKWVYKIKKNEKGEIVKNKSRLVALGYSQVKGQDYHETYSPVLMKKSIRILLAISVEKEWKTKHIDVLSAYLNSPIKEEVYMEQPKGFEEQGKSAKNFVCKLKKSIYGLHQSGRDWCHYITDCLRKIGLERSLNEPCVFFTKNLILGVYVDDILMIGKEKEIEFFLKKLEKEVSVRDLGEVNCILSLSVSKTEIGLHIGQKIYAQKLLEKFDMHEAGHSPSPLPIDIFSGEEGKFFDSTYYRKAIGSLLYLSNNTRPDLAYAVCALSQKNSEPTENDWNNVTRVFRYLKGTIDIGINFVKTKEPVQLYVDSSWANNKPDRKSIYGVIALLAGSTISWYAKKSYRVANSTLQAEYIAMDEGTRETLWLQHLFEELNLSDLISKPTTIYCDNQGAIVHATRSVVTEKTKHYDTMLHVQRECVALGEVVFKYVASNKNKADAFTKSLSPSKLKIFRDDVSVSFFYFLVNMCNVIDSSQHM